MRLLHKIALITVLVPSLAKAETVYSAVAGFGSANSAGSPWTYGYTDGTQVLSFGAIQSNYGNTAGDSYYSSSNTGLPAAIYNLAGMGTHYSYLSVPANQILIHPGPTDGAGISGDLIALFTAPTSGNYVIDDFFSRQDNGNGVNIGIYVDGVLKGGASLPGTFGAHYRFDNGTKYFLHAGDTIAVDLNNNGDYSSDSTGFSSVITQTPEPSSLALLGTGVLGVAGFARRKLHRS